MQPAGWYHAEGDPVGTKRYWDGSMWIGEPTTMTADNGGAPGNSASTGKRIGARIIDWLLMGIGAGIPAMIAVLNHLDFDALPDAEDPDFQSLLQTELEAQFETFSLGIGVGLVAIFFVLWEILWLGFAGASPGKMLLGLRVQNAKTGEVGPGWVAAVLRNLLRFALIIPVASGLFFLIAVLGLFASVVMLFSDSQGRTLVDRIASTVVVDKKSLAET